MKPWQSYLALSLLCTANLNLILLGKDPTGWRLMGQAAELGALSIWGFIFLIKAIILLNKKS